MIGLKMLLVGLSIRRTLLKLKSADRGNDKKGWNIVDMWKLEDGKIVEHWDSIQSLDLMMRIYSAYAGGQIRNGNGVFLVNQAIRSLEYELATCIRTRWSGAR